MEDIRKTKFNNKLNRRANFGKFWSFIEKHWGKMLTFVIILILIFFPGEIGSIIGMWVNTIISTFMDAFNANMIS